MSVTFVLVNDFVIPKGTKVTRDPPHKTSYATDNVSILISTSKDTTAELIMDWDEATQLGLIEELKT
jgi:hypothetical protein